MSKTSDTDDDRMGEIRPRNEVPEGPYEHYTLPMRTLAISEARHALVEEFQNNDYVGYEPIQQLSDGAWLISVRGRVYEVAEDVLEAGLDDAEGELIDARVQGDYHE